MGYDLAMLSSLGVILLLLGTLAALVIWLVWQSTHTDKRANWPVVEGTIQSVNTEYTYRGRMSSADTVGDFSYKVGGEYYSGRLSISDSNTLADYAPRILIGRKISTHYNPQKPKEFFVAPANIDGFSIGQHTDEILQSDLDPTVLNIDKD